jgi:hypothetical protein
VRGRQEIIVDFEPERAVETLPQLLAKPEDRARLLTLMERLFSDPRVQGMLEPTDEQIAMFARIRAVLGREPSEPGLPPPARGGARRKA